MIDHKAEALFHTYPEGDDNPQRYFQDRDYAARVGQIHATLYLAEQQRIANLLAFAQFHAETPDGASVGTQLEAIIAIRTQAGELLGIEASVDVEGQK